jgi:hypothetical protein
LLITIVTLPIYGVHRDNSEEVCYIKIKGREFAFPSPQILKNFDGKGRRGKWIYSGDVECV